MFVCVFDRFIIKLTDTKKKGWIHSMNKTRIVSGIQASGSITLGNYLGAAQHFVTMQNDDKFESFIFVADLHAITVPQNPQNLRQSIINLIKFYLAIGLDPQKVCLFIQSEIPAHAATGWILQCHSYMGELERMTQYKDKAKKINAKQSGIGAGLFAYPPLMAADILLYDPKYVPVGEDQKQHLELTRTLAQRMNHHFQMEFFVIPEPFIAKSGARIMALQEPTKKMSKSDENKKNTIFLFDPINQSLNKIKSAKTDSDTIIRYDKDEKPGISNLLTIYASLENITIDEAETLFKTSSYGTFKKEVSAKLEAFLIPLHEKFHSYSKQEIYDILDAGHVKAQSIAQRKFEKLAHKIGLGRY